MRHKRDKLFKLRSWEFLKDLVENKKLKLDYEENQNGIFRAFVTRGNTEYFVNLFPPDFGHVIGKPDSNDDDYNEFLTNYKDVVDENPPANILMVKDPKTGNATEAFSDPITGDGKKRVLASHKPIIPGKEMYNFFTSAGDNPITGVLASGTQLAIETTSGTLYQAHDVHFSNEYSPLEYIQVFGGGVCWEGAGWGDEISLGIEAIATQIVPRSTAEGLGLDVDYNLSGQKIVYAGPDQGDYALGGYPVWVPNYAYQGTWDLDKANYAAVPNASGTGAFDWYSTPQHVGHYIKNLFVYGDNYQYLLIDGTESAPLPYGHFLRLEAINNSDTDWRAWGFMKVYRERLK